MPPDRNISARRKYSSERDQLDLSDALPGDLATRYAQDLMAYPSFSLAKSRRVAPINFLAGTVSIPVEAVLEHGMATIWDADVLICAPLQIVGARDAGLATSRLMGDAHTRTEVRRGRSKPLRIPSNGHCKLNGWDRRSISRRVDEVAGELLLPLQPGTRYSTSSGRCQ